MLLVPRVVFIYKFSFTVCFFPVRIVRLWFCTGEDLPRPLFSRVSMTQNFPVWSHGHKMFRSQTVILRTEVSLSKSYFRELGLHHANQPQTFQNLINVFYAHFCLEFLPHWSNKQINRPLTHVPPSCLPTLKTSNPIRWHLDALLGNGGFSHVRWVSSILLWTQGAAFH